ncbi:DNA recombination protein RmuC [Xylanibacter ruminicola]|uniref:DNA recombination protein RmuC n=1 Tax=Xylanibacter ruminicola TaxID=839 RepID=A0A1M6X0A9_XYLRU|nr:DNA recombination protein RmuC [Xylanibacter ruminicola]SHK99354.1 DNA recombination protein RmuC [Xylanibacter ruminicola]
MMIVLYIIIGIAVGAVVLYLLMDKKMDALRIEGGKKEMELSMKGEQLAEATSRVRHLEAENKDLHAKSESQGRELELVRQQMKEELQRHEERFKNMAQQLLEQSASKLKDSNTETMTGITQPLKDAIANMQKAINDNQKESAAHSASFREQMLMMMQQTQQLGEKAESLTNVLRRDNKVSGNMGEIILGDLLTSQGLTEGIHYEVQARLRDELGKPMKHDETGREMQPDVILHYPQGQDAIIDSKVSLVAYEKYVNAESPEDKERYLQDHIKSVRSHVNELARKDYSKYIKNGRDAVDFVIMFVPFESSLQLALANDPTLWREAFEKKVFVTGEQNLLGILHMIHIAWVQNQQAENQEKVFGLAEQLLDRLGDFVQRYNDLGEKLHKVQEVYDSTNNKLITGRQSVAQKARELVDLGAKENPNRRIPKPEIAIE